MGRSDEVVKVGVVDVVMTDFEEVVVVVTVGDVVMRMAVVVVGPGVVVGEGEVAEEVSVVVVVESEGRRGPGGKGRGG